MATKMSPRFDESEDEDDFNPAPADLSDNDAAGDDQTSSSTSRMRRNGDQALSDIDTRRESRFRNVEADDDTNDEDADAERTSIAGDEDDEGEDDEDDIQHVSRNRIISLFPRNMAYTSTRVTGESVVGTGAMLSLISRLRLMMKMREKMKRKMVKKSRTSLIMSTRTI